MAGKEIDGKKIGGWVRPVSGRSSHEISEHDRQYSDGSLAELLDIIVVEMIAPRPGAYQTENHLINDTVYWEKTGAATWQQIVAATDDVPALWHNGTSSYHGQNDKVPEEIANNLRSSLLLIEPQSLTLIVGQESLYGGGSKRKVRGRFMYKNISYNFVVTDPHIEDTYFKKPDGSSNIGECRLCVSLAEVIGDHAIKLVAAVITPDRIV